MLELNSIHQGDCLEVMKEIDDKSIDLTVTSPPYDNLRDYNGYTFDFEGIAKELYRITKDGGVVVWVVGDATVNGSETGTSFKQALYFKEIGFNLHDTMIWVKYGLPQNNKRYEPAFEYMFILSKEGPAVFNAIREKRKWKDFRTSKAAHRNNKDEFVKGYAKRSEDVTSYNVWNIPAGGGHCGDKIAHKHPAIFPEELAKNHIISWSNEGDLVLDCFSGSGTTCKMAKLTGRNYIGIELSADYCKLAEKRLKNTIRNEEFSY